jgi:mono/diheme cytochrome c family protein
MKDTLIVLGLAAAVGAGLASAPRPQPDAAQDVVAAGRLVYQRECAACHGEAGTGYGPASWGLRERPPDLTRFVNRTVPFPTDKIRSQITAHIRLVPSHGRPDMPAWRGSLEAASTAPGVTQMEALLAYLASIQLFEFGPGKGPMRSEIIAAGRSLFESHCATCHGKDGRRPPVPGYTVGIAIDLTTMASRHGGALDSGKLYESIARCGKGWEKSDMPSWSREFKREGWSGYVTTKMLEALAAFVESIQR